ncbi:MAG: hypothetical protein MMC23_002904 [Stictis urceolatum]|nr:hypothetical protein [Stictis urceolata]
MTLIRKPPMAQYKILIINPNSTKSMTDALIPLVKKLSYSETSYTYLTGPPSSPPSVNDRDDIAKSAHATLPETLMLLPSHDAALVACYSPHPLVGSLRQQTTSPVTGILEASVGAAMQLIGAAERFGIISTGKQWEEILGEAVGDVLRGKAGWNVAGEEGKGKWEVGPFAGVETTGLDAKELHEAPRKEVEKRVKEATKRLMERGGVKAILLGCAGMSGMDLWVRDAAGREVWIVDGVLAGVAALQGTLRGAFGPQV